MEIENTEIIAIPIIDFTENFALLRGIEKEVNDKQTILKNNVNLIF